MTPILRVAAGGAVALATLLVGGGIGFYVSHRAQDLKTTGTRIASLPATPTSLPGDRQLPDAEHAYRQFEHQNRTEAERREGPAAAVPPLDTLEPAPQIAPEAERPVSPEVSRRERELDRDEKKAQAEREKTHQDAIKQQAQGMGKVLAAWGGVHKTVEATLKPPAPAEPVRPAAAGALDPLAHLSADKVYYGILQVFISSDEPGPVVVTVKDGELAGARLIGSFKRADEKVIIHFDRMTFRKAWYAVDAVAINPENGRLGLATDVDRRTFTRWAALLGSAVLQGAQRAYLNQGTQNSYLWGESSTHNYSDQEILGIAIGEIGTRTRQAANRYFDRPPTVYVDPAIQLVGVLFMAPPSRKTDGQMAANAEAAASVAAAGLPRQLELLDAAKMAGGEASTAAENRDEPRERPTAPLLVVPAHRAAPEDQ